LVYGNIYEQHGQQPPAMPGYPAPRRRTGLIVAIVVSCLVVVGGGVGLAIGLSTSSGDDRSAGPGDTAAVRPTTARPSVKLPPGCELLTQAQVTALVPGRIRTPIGSGPEAYGTNQLASRCSWSNDPVDAGRDGLPAVTVEATAITSVSERDARTEYESGPMCGGKDVRPTTVAGADEACVEHGVTDDDTGQPTDDSIVAARHATVVVEVHLSHPELAIDVIDHTVVTTTAAVLGMLAQA
jgi:hypothetical protein